VDEQRSSRRCGRTQEHAHASRRKTGRTAGYRDRKKRNPDAVPDANSNDGAQAEPDSYSYAKEFPEADGKADSQSHAEKERRTQVDAEAYSEKGEGRFGKEIRDSKERVEPIIIESKFRQDRESRQRIG
jgi:hypothetical protein